MVFFWSRDKLKIPLILQYLQPSNLARWWHTMKTTTHKVTWFLKRVILWGYMTFSGPNLDHLYIWQLDAASFCKNYAKLYFDAKLLEMGLKKCLYGQYLMMLLGSDIKYFIYPLLLDQWPRNMARWWLTEIFHP